MRIDPTRQVLDAADRHSPELSQLVYDAVEAAQSEISLAGIERDLRAGRIPDIASSLEKLEEVLRGDDEKLLRTLAAKPQKGAAKVVHDTVVAGANASSCVVPIPDRNARAKAAFKPAGKDKQDRGEANEGIIAKMLKGKNLDNNEPMDVLTKVKNKLAGVEVKTMVDNANDKITVRKAAQERKLNWAKREKASLHTVVIDDRDVFAPTLYSGNKYYYARGTGSFRVNRMIPVKDAKDMQKLMEMTPQQLKAELAKRLK